MDPMNWGWQTTKHGLAPNTTIKNLSLQSLLTAVFCKCARGCRSTGSSKKSGFKCSANCANCKAHSCSNALPETDRQMLQLSEKNKDPDDAEEMGNLYYH
ncbi:hypothetical protein AVEN_125188-1 [Araneus ventricosus]|uniref:Tesmin/TSO1-like CXC domain-containing protein n=1 Tax=Araneus ventricosus TaxID=182803 RepID=A0A4Y2NHG9_ARAVE|nr:hypothetical protein AVEN_125188-1 [Araneus ventricosus]